MGDYSMDLIDKLNECATFLESIGETAWSGEMRRLVAESFDPEQKVYKVGISVSEEIESWWRGTMGSMGDFIVCSQYFPEIPEEQDEEYEAQWNSLLGSLSSVAGEMDRCIRTSMELKESIFGIQCELAKARNGEEAVAPESQLLSILSALETMLANLDQSDMPEAPGLERPITDSWPLRHPLSEKILSAKLSYMILRKSKRNRNKNS